MYHTTQRMKGRRKARPEDYLRLTTLVKVNEGRRLPPEKEIRLEATTVTDMWSKGHLKWYI